MNLWNITLQCSISNDWIKILVILPLLSVNFDVYAQTTTETIPKGSFIVDMGVAPQTVDNALKPYGMIWELLHDHYVPIKWSIKDGKGKDGIDFTYNGKNYRGGPFIILAEYRSSEVNAVINNWVNQGVVGTTNTTDFDAPIERTINYSMNWTLDHENGDIAEAYLEAAGIPESAYNWVLPNDLNCCNDVFLMPHAHPDWSSHNNLLYWNDNPSNGGCSGAIWAGCKAVSELENIYNPSNPTESLNFLMNDSGTTPAVWSDDHDDGDGKYEHDLHDHPIMQFMGKLDGAQENGAEQIYIPTNGWRTTTDIGVWQNNHPDAPNNTTHKAAKLAFGYAFGDSNRGYVGYEAAHKLNKSKDAESIAAQRAFLNFSFRAVEDKAILPLGVVPPTMSSGATYTLTSSASGGSGEYVFHWTSTCGGTFSNPYASTTTFTAPSVTEETTCMINLVVTDDCGTRIGFNSFNITMGTGPAPPVAVDDVEQTSPCTAVNINAIFNDSDPNNDPLTLSLTGATNTGNGVFVDNGDGTVTYTPNAGFSGTDQITYEICDTTALCDNATISVTVSANQAPSAVNDASSTTENTPVLIDVLNNDSDPEGGILSLSISSNPSNGSVVIQNKKILYTPDIGFVGTDQFNYQICDNACSPLCDIASVTISVACDPVLGELNINGVVFLDNNSNGVLESGESGEGGVQINLYEDINGDGVVDGGDSFIQSTNTNNNGSYTFSLVPSFPSSSSSSTITSNKAVSNYEGDQNQQFGACEWIWLENEDGYLENSFIQFDFSSLDPNCTITSADLILTHGNGDEKGDDFQFGVRRVTSSWNEGVGACYGSDPNGLTWNSTGTGNWSTAGGDFASTIYATETGGKDDSEGTTYSLNVTTLVNEWLNGTYTNNGLALVPTSPDNKEAWFTLHSDDSPTFSKRPKLQLTIQCPTDIDYVLEINTSTLPANTSLTADNIETLTFTGLGEIECSNNFGFEYNTPQPPMAQDDYGDTPICTSITVDVLANDSDPANQALTITSLGSGSNGTFLNNGNGTVTYTPNIGYTGSDNASYTVCNTDGQCDNANIYINVSGNQSPVANDDNAYTSIDSTIFINVLTNDAEPDGENLSFNILSQPVNGTVTKVGTQIEFIPDAGFSGMTTFTYEACDDNCSPLCDPATVAVEVGCLPISGQATIYGNVYLDANGDGINDSNEAGANNVTINLYHDINEDGLLDGGDTLVTTQNTDANGDYQFSLTELAYNGNSVSSCNGDVIKYLTYTGNESGAHRAPTIINTSSVASASNISNGPGLSLANASTNFNISAANSGRFK